MNTKKLLLASLGTLTLSAVDIPLPDLTPTFNSHAILSRFSDDEDLILPIDISNFSPSYKLEVAIYNNLSNEQIYTRTYQGLLDFADNISPFEIELPIKGYLKAEGLKIEFTHSYRNRTYRHDSAVIYPFQKQSFNVATYRKEPIVCKGNYISIKDYEISTDEIFDFTNLNEYITFSRNNILDLSTLVFRYESPIDFEASKLTLNIKDHSHIFNYLKMPNNVVSFPLKPVQNGNDVLLVIDEQLYVNTETLEMSDHQFPGFVETDKFYVPIHREEDFLKDEVYITMEDCGFSLADIHIPFKFFYAKKYVGECYESDYCVHGGIKE